MWMKIIIRDDLNDLFTLFLPYYRKVKFNNTTEIKAFHDYSKAEISGILNDNRIVSCSLIPYNHV